MKFEEWLMTQEVEEIVEQEESVNERMVETRVNLAQHVSDILGVDITLPDEGIQINPWESSCWYTTKDGVCVRVSGGPQRVYVAVTDPDDWEIGHTSRFELGDTAYDKSFRASELKDGYLDVAEQKKTKLRKAEMIAQAPTCDVTGLYQFVGKESVLTVDVEPFQLALTISMLNGNAITFEFDVIDVPMMTVMSALLDSSPWRHGDYLMNVLQVSTTYRVILTRYQSDADDEPMRSVNWYSDRQEPFIELMKSLSGYYLSLYEWADTYAKTFATTTENALFSLQRER